MLPTLEQSFLHRKLQADNATLAQSLVLCWLEAEPLLRHAAATNPTFTSHGPDHALAVVEILDQATKPIFPRLELTADEIYILLCAALLHDIGMVGPVDASSESRDRLRKEHNTRSLKYIVSNCKMLHIVQGYSHPIGYVAAAHRQLDIEKDVWEGPVGTHSSSTPRTKLCAALLRLADECHLTADRVPSDYGMLGLAQESANHFRSHLSITGRGFDADEGTISFSVSVDTEEMDEFLRKTKTKLAEELEGLQSLFRRYGVPYSKVVWNELRDKLIHYKVVLTILECGSSSLDTLVDSTGETEEHLSRFLRVFGSSSPFTTTSEDGNSLYSLLENEPVFHDLVEKFLLTPRKHRDSLAFVQSGFCQQALSEDLLGRIVGNFLSRTEERPIAYRIVRESPSALKYILTNEGKLPRANIGGSGGLLTSLIGGLENDFHTFPELLLNPGLLDEVFDEGKRDSDKWNQWRLFQIREYHRAFDEKTILNQWVVPDEWERRASPSAQNAGSEFSFSVTGPEEQLCDPGPLMAASKRLGIPLRLEPNDSVKITVEYSDPAGHTQEKKEVKSMEFGASHNLGSMHGFLPCRLVASNASHYVIEVPPTNEVRLKEWTLPFRLGFHITSPQGDLTAGKQKVQGKFTLVLNADLLDCVEAFTLIEAREHTEASYAAKVPQISPEEIQLASDGRNMLPTLDLEGDERAFIEVLARLQRVTGKRIPYPFAGWPVPVQEAALQKAHCCEKDAKGLWHDILNKINEVGKPTISPCVAEVELDGVCSDRVFLDFHLGVHQPRMNFSLSSAAVDDPHAELERSLDDPAQKTWARLPLRNSPEAAICFLLHGAGHKDRIHPGKLCELRALSPAEYRTWVEYRWEPINDHVWYNLTPFRCVLTAQKSHERWLAESAYLSENKGDLKRAYLAAKEGYRSAPAETNSCVNFGWRAFECGRIDEAIKITMQALSEKEGEQKFPAIINIGLFCLRGAMLLCENRERYLKDAEDYYTQAMEAIRQLDKGEALSRTEEAVNDIQRFRDRLDSIAETYLDRFRALRAELLT